MNAGPKSGVPEVEVEAGHPPVGLAEGEPHLAAGVAAVFALGGGEHVLVLLRDPDRRHTRHARSRPAAAGRDASPLACGRPWRTAPPGSDGPSAKARTARRNGVPIFSMIAGDGIG